MRRALTLLILLLLATHVVAIGVDFHADVNLPEGYEEQVRQSVEQLLSPRLEAGSTLTAHLDDGWLLTLFSDHGSLAIVMPPSTAAVADTLRSALLWDVEELITSPSGGRLSFPLSYGFALAGLDRPRHGDAYWAVGRDGKRLGSVRIVRVVEADEPTVVAAQSSGRALLPHMGIERAGVLAFGLYGSSTLQGDFGVEAVVSQRLPRYPFEARWGVGYNSPESVTVRLGVGATLYMSHLVGTRTEVGRNLAAEGWADLGLGWSDGLLLSASVRLGLSYHLCSWKVSALVGNTVGATASTALRQGLFFTVGTAYTYTP